MEILYILIPSVAIPLAIALLFFFICVCRNNQKSSRPPAPRQPKPVRGQNVEMSMLTTAYKPKVGRRRAAGHMTGLMRFSGLPLFLLNSQECAALAPFLLSSAALSSVASSPRPISSIRLFVIVSRPPFLHLWPSFSSFISSLSFCNATHRTCVRLCLPSRPGVVQLYRLCVLS